MIAYVVGAPIYYVPENQLVIDVVRQTGNTHLLKLLHTTPHLHIDSDMGKHPGDVALIRFFLEQNMNFSISPFRTYHPVRLYHPYP